jgi:site-specific DNA recombinase
LVACGPCPFGYRADPGSRGGLAIVDDEAATVRLIFRLFLDERRSAREIAVELSRLGIAAPRARRWNRQAIRRILVSRTYIGEWVYETRGHAPVVVPVPAITTPETFERARRQLERNRVLLVGRPGRVVYLLRGLLRCGACGHRWHGGTWHARYRAYRCNGRNRYEYEQMCPTLPLKADFLERLVWETVAGILRSPDALTERIDEHLTRLGVREVEVRSEAEYLAHQIDELERQTRRLLDLYQRGDGLEDDLRARLTALGDQRRAARDRLEQARRQAVAAGSSEQQGDAVAQACQDALRGLELATPAERQRLLQLLVHQITVLDNGAELAIDGWLPTAKELTAASRTWCRTR